MSNIVRLKLGTVINILGLLGLIIKANLQGGIGEITT